MTEKNQKSESSVMGITLKTPRRRLKYFMDGLMYIGLPVFGGLLALDILFYMIFDQVFDSCYGVMCFFE